MPTLVIATCEQYPALPNNLQPLAELLAQDFQLSIRPWQQIQTANVVLPLCAWDYAQMPEQFRTWLNQLVAQGTRFPNSVRLMQWNMHKRYLCDLRDWGVNVIPSLYLAQPTEALIYQAMQQQGWHTAVIKPAIGQSGRLVQKISQNQPLATLVEYGEVLLQPYIPEVAEVGETSLIFFNGNFSHAIHRQPQEGDFRANSVYGVQISAQTVDENIISQAQNVLSKLPQKMGYVRVDGTIIGDQFLLNELELIEPALYLDQAVGSAQYFAKVLKSCIYDINQGK